MTTNGEVRPDVVPVQLLGRSANHPVLTAEATLTEALFGN